MTHVDATHGTVLWVLPSSTSEQLVVGGVGVMCVRRSGGSWRCAVAALVSRNKVNERF